MGNALVVRKIIEKLAREMQDWNVKSSNVHSSDADWYIGFGDDNNTANENEHDPRTGEVVKNDHIGSYATYLQQWDADNTGYLEGEERKNTGFGKIVMQQLMPIGK
jgi:hypothetical protein